MSCPDPAVVAALRNQAADEGAPDYTPKAGPPFEDWTQNPRIKGPDDAVPLFWEYVPEDDMREHFLALYLDSRGTIIGSPYVVSVGSLNASIVHPREVFAPAITRHAASLVLMHNHPSGDPQPSEEDHGITKRLLDAGRVLGLPVLDHIVLGSFGGAWVSMRAATPAVWKALGGDR